MPRHRPKPAPKRKPTPTNNPKPRKADAFAKGKTSIFAKSKARREAIEAGDLQGAAAAFKRGYYKKPKK